MKYDKQFKLRVIKKCLSGKRSVRSIARTHALVHSLLQRWVASYQAHGHRGVSRRHRRYDVAFKLSVLRRMWRDGLSYGRTAVLFDIREPEQIGRWERQYHAGGQDALASRPRGQPPAMSAPKPPKPVVSGPSDDQRTREDLLKELEYLRAENAYLKKLDALIQAKKSAARKPRS